MPISSSKPAPPSTRSPRIIRFTPAAAVPGGAVPGVASARPLYIEYPRRSGDIAWTSRPAHSRTPSSAPPALRRAGVADQCPRLEEVDTALIDMKSEGRFPSSRADHRPRAGDHSVRVIGTFPPRHDFVNDGNLIISTAPYAASSRTPWRRRRRFDFVDIGLVRLSPAPISLHEEDAGARASSRTSTVHDALRVRRDGTQFWPTQRAHRPSSSSSAPLSASCRPVPSATRFLSTTWPTTSRYSPSSLGYPNNGLIAVVLRMLSACHPGYIPVHPGDRLSLYSSAVPS